MGVQREGVNPQKDGAEIPDTSEFEHRVALCGATDLGDVPRWVLIVPWGVVEGAGDRFIVDEEAGRLAIEAFEAHGTDIPIDYEHQTLGGEYASPTGQAPAAGWIRRLVLRVPRADAAGPGSDGQGQEGQGEGSRAQPDRAEDGGPAGLWAEVQWTEPARAQLAARQYRYLSPVAIVRKADRRLVAIHSVALTNKPAIAGMRAIVNRAGGDPPAGGAARSREPTGDGPGAKTEGRAAPGGDANPAEQAEEVKQMTEALERLRGQLGMHAEAPAEAVLVAACERLSRLEQTIARARAEEQVLAAMKAGKLTEAQREWALGLALKDPSGFEAWEAAAPVLVASGRTSPPDAAGRDEGEVVAARARSEYRAHPELGLLTSEEAYAALAVRDARNGR